jgi:undecaprenyl pyrophosphate phosphatase UppP
VYAAVQPRASAAATDAALIASPVVWRRLIGHAAIISLIAFYSPIAIGLPLLLAVTLPAGAIMAVLEMRRLQRDRKEVGIVTDTDIARKRRRRAVVLAVSVAVFVIGLFVNALPSQDLHDDHWLLFVAPSMIAFMVGVIALLMLAWSYVPRRQNETMNSSAKL